MSTMLTATNPQSRFTMDYQLVQMLFGQMNGARTFQRIIIVQMYYRNQEMRIRVRIPQRSCRNFPLVGSVRGSRAPVVIFVTKFKGSSMLKRFSFFTKATYFLRTVVCPKELIIFIHTTESMDASKTPKHITKLFSLLSTLHVVKLSVQKFAHTLDQRNQKLRKDRPNSLDILTKNEAATMNRSQIRVSHVTPTFFLFHTPMFTRTKYQRLCNPSQNLYLTIVNRQKNHIPHLAVMVIDKFGVVL